jgi:predicted transcriptional regulator
VKFRVGNGKEITLCTLPLGVCPPQEKQKDLDGKEMVVCSQPHTVLTNWQVVEVEKLPADDVRRYMTADPVTARTDTLIRTLARMMIDAHIHRVIVVDEQQRPVGVVSSTDILSAVAYAESV